MTNIKEQLSAHYDPAESSDLLGRDIGSQDKTMLEKIVNNFAPNLGLHPVGEMLEPTPILTNNLDDAIDYALYEKPAMQIQKALKANSNANRKVSQNSQRTTDGIGFGAKLKKIFSR
jgi:hypothetical protein